VKQSARFSNLPVAKIVTLFQTVGKCGQKSPIFGAFFGFCELIMEMWQAFCIISD
jgi:hypothetical protein